MDADKLALLSEDERTLRSAARFGEACFTPPSRETGRILYKTVAEQLETIATLRAEVARLKARLGEAVNLLEWVDCADCNEHASEITVEHRGQRMYLQTATTAFLKEPA